jgi:hypothetical protein
MRSCLSSSFRAGILSAFIVLAGSLPADAQQAHETDEPAWTASIGLIGVPSYLLYDGPLYLQSESRTQGADYEEHVNKGMGLRAELVAKSKVGGRLAFMLYGSRGSSTAEYAGLTAPETATRSLLVVGADFGWHPTVLQNGAFSVALPFGPSVAWQRLRLSEGHRDVYADPLSGTSPTVEWSDRTWSSLGGHAGVKLSVHTGAKLGFVVAGRGRFLFNRGMGSWEGQEQRDIARSTGNSVSITYEDLIVVQSALEAGIEWRM